MLRLQYTLARCPEVCHLHSHTALPQRHHTRLGTDGFDVGTGQVVLLRDKLLEFHIVVEVHLGGVEGEDLALGVLVGILEKDLAIDTTGSDQGRIECLDFVGGHDDLDIASVIETIELVEKLKHSTLHLALTTRCGIVSFRTDCVDLVDEDNGWSILAGNLTIESVR